MSTELQLTQIFLALASAPVVTGYFEKGEPGYEDFQFWLIYKVNKQILQPSDFHAVYFGSYQAFEWDAAKSKVVMAGRTFEKSTLEAVCRGPEKVPCKKAVNDIWDLAKKGKSSAALGVSGVYTSCADLKVAVGRDSPVQDCA